MGVSFTLTCLEVMAGGVSKGHAGSGRSGDGVQSEKSVSPFGDGMNDAEMLTMAGKGCIMGNAHQRLKDLYPELGGDRASTRITPPPALIFSYADVIVC